MWWCKVKQQGEKKMVMKRKTSTGAKHGATCCRWRDPHFFCSFLFLSAGPPRVPTPRPSLGVFSASGVPAENRGDAVRSGKQAIVFGFFF